MLDLIFFSEVNLCHFPKFKFVFIQYYQLMILIAFHAVEFTVEHRTHRQSSFPFQISI